MQANTSEILYCCQDEHLRALLSANPLMLDIKLVNLKASLLTPAQFQLNKISAIFIDNAQFLHLLTPTPVAIFICKNYWKVDQYKEFKIKYKNAYFLETPLSDEQVNDLITFIIHHYQEYNNSQKLPPPHRSTYRFSERIKRRIQIIHLRKNRTL